jgi:hypothetical protein
VSRHRITADTTARLGDKLGPRLAELIARYSMGVRGRLSAHESRVMAAALQQLLDRGGEEMATLYKPILAGLLASHGEKMHPTMARHFERVSSGAHQWESILGHAGMAASSALQSVLSNYLFPATAELNHVNPQLQPDQQTAAQAVAAGIISVEMGQYLASLWGYDANAFTVLTELAEVIPGAAEIGQLVSRGDLDATTGTYWLGRAGIPLGLQAEVLSLRRQLLTPPDLALAVLRGELEIGPAAAEAARSGMERGDFEIMLANTGEPLGLEQLLEARRRGFIDDAQLRRGILQSRVRDEWIPTAEKLAYAPVPTADAVDAALRGHLTWAQAEQIATQNGIEAAQFQILEANAGNPLAPEQLLELLRRGEIDQATAETGMRFGRLRDDYVPMALKLTYEPMSTADAVDAALRGHLTWAQAQQRATENGLMERDWPATMANAGNPLGLEQLLEALRRGFIDAPAFEQGFRESRYRDQWSGVALKLGYSPISTADAVDALIQGHMTQDEAEKAAHDNGLEPQYFAVLAATAGDPLSRTEAQELQNRGVLSQAEVDQALRESRLKDKYIPAAAELRWRLPEPRQVIEALTEGVVTEDAAEQLLAEAGYRPSVVAMMIATAEARSTGPDRQLAAGQVGTLYSDRIIDRETAAGLLVKLHYSASTAEILLGLADWNHQHRILQSGVGALRTHYLAGRIDDATVGADLAKLGLPPSAVATYLQVWGLDRLAHPKQLTEAQIVKAAKLNLLVTTAGLTGDALSQANQQAGCQRLVALGYDAGDAQLLLAGA